MRMKQKTISFSEHDLNVFNQASWPMLTLWVTRPSFNVFPSFLFLQLWPSFLKCLCAFRSKRKSEPPEIGNTCLLMICLYKYILNFEKLREKRRRRRRSNAGRCCTFINFEEFHKFQTGIAIDVVLLCVFAPYDLHSTKSH
jgi:hypothetical protein